MRNLIIVSVLCISAFLVFFTAISPEEGEVYWITDIDCWHTKRIKTQGSVAIMSDTLWISTKHHGSFHSKIVEVEDIKEGMIIITDNNSFIMITPRFILWKTPTNEVVRLWRKLPTKDET